MRLSQLDIGDIEVFEVQVAQELPRSWGRDQEVALQRAGRDLALHAGSDLVPVRARGRAYRDLERLAAQQVPCIVRIADIKGDAIFLQVYRFSGAVALDVAIGVDERVLQTAQKLRSGLRSVSAVRGWLGDQCLLAGATTRAFLSAGHDPEIGDHFTMHGRSVRAMVERVRRAQDGSDSLQVTRITRGRASSARHPIVLAQGKFRFTDTSEEHRLRVEASAELHNILGQQDSFMATWRRYGEIEGDSILRRARAIGVLSYDRTESLEDGSVRLVLARDQAVNDAVSELAAGDLLEICRKAPAALTDPALTWADIQTTSAGQGARPLLAALRERPSRGHRTLRVTPRDRDGFHVPERGLVHLSVRGDARRLERRDQARDRIWSASARMPQLAQLLEGRRVTSRVLRKAVIPRAVYRKMFSDHPPTPSQEEAIRIALETPDIALIQGPPGTGKTTVIRAIVECLNHQQQRVAEPGQILVTGFQHVAVENAIARMQVNGVPPIKLGKPGGSGALDDVDERIEQWRDERIKAMRESLPGIDEHESLVRVRRMVEGYLLTPTPPGQTATLLGQVIREVEGQVPPRLMDELRALRAELTPPPDESAPAELANHLAALRALRTTRVSWDDDGWYTGAHVLALARRSDFLDASEQALLARVLSRRPPTDADLRELAALRRQALLRELRRRQQRTPRAVIRRDVARVLIDVREAVEDTTRPQHQGADAVAAQFLDQLRSDPLGVRRAVIAYTLVYASTCQQSAGRDAATAKRDDVVYDTVIVDEAARANPLDLLIPLSQARRRIILVGDHRQLPHIVDDQILADLADEVDDTTARDRMASAIRDSLFDRLYQDVKRRSADDQIARCVRLDDQFRMHPVLGEFVSQQFYGGGVRSPRPAQQFFHELPELDGRPAAWLDVPHSRGAETRGRSKSRAVEADVLVDMLARLMSSPAGAGLSFGAITFYAAQVTLLQDRLERAGVLRRVGASGYEVTESWDWPRDRRGGDHTRLQVGTVDAFQGREFDVVLLSMVRSNQLPDREPRQRQRKYGHLMSPNRMCVAMSRQKKLLIVVGDASMLRAPHARGAIGPLVEFFALCEGEDGVVV